MKLPKLLHEGNNWRNHTLQIAKLDKKPETFIRLRFTSSKTLAVLGGGSPMEQSSTYFLHVKYNFFKKQNGKDWHLSILKLFHQQLIPFFGILKLYCCKCGEDHCLSQLYNQWHAFYLWEFNGFLWCFSAGLWQWGPDSQSALTRGRFLPLITPFIPKEGTRSTPLTPTHRGPLIYLDALNL